MERYESAPMPRREIPFLPDQYYHFFHRGNNRLAVSSDMDLKYFPSPLLTITVSSVDKKKVSLQARLLD